MVLYESPVRVAESKIRDKLPWIVDQLLELAAGVQVEKTTLTGQRVVYQQPPDRQACTYLLDRIMGQPRQPVDHGTQDGQPLAVKHEFDYADYHRAFIGFASGRAAELTLAGADGTGESVDHPHADDGAGVFSDGPAA